jgi:hypothetical protein
MSDFTRDDHDPENCPGCRPCVFDPETGEVNAYLTEAAGVAFRAATPEERKAWHRVTCLNSRDPIDVTLANRIVKALQRAVAN